jgi:hypothetical protein
METNRNKWRKEGTLNLEFIHCGHLEESGDYNIGKQSYF